MLQRKHVITIILAFIIVCLMYFLLVMYPRIGKIPVEVLVNPDGASIYIDNNRATPGIHYLHEGSHTFKAEKAGWTPDEVAVSVTDSTTSVALLPQPESSEAKQQAERDSLIREGLSGVAANVRGLGIRNSYPILNDLPYSDPSGPYKIDYGFNQDDKKTPYLVVSFSTPNGRSEAIDWLKDNDVDPTSLEIIFEGFESPIYKKEDAHGNE